MKKTILHSALKNNSGASLLFVLAAMFLLFAIGTSVLVAAAASRGRVVQQEVHNQIRLLDESVQRNIMHSLRIPDRTSLTAPPELTLGEELIMAVLIAWEAGGHLRISGGTPPNINAGTLDMSFLGDFDIGNSTNDVQVEKITLEVTQQDVQETPAIPQSIAERFQVYDDENAENYGNWIINQYTGLPISFSPPQWDVVTRQPRTVSVTISLTVRVYIRSDGRTTVSQTEYSDEFIISDGSGYPEHDCASIVNNPSDPQHGLPQCLNRKCTGIFLDSDDEPEMRIISGEDVWDIVSKGQMISS